jgi:HSP20 family protein
MKIRDLIPWNRGNREGSARQNGGDDTNAIRALQTDINRVFDDFWRGFGPPALRGWDDELEGGGLPPVDLRETDKAVEVVAELPGMDEADVDVRVADGTLVIRGEKKSERDREEKGYVLRERTFGTIQRVVPLPEALELDSAKATFKKGLLTVTIPKTAEAQSAVKRVTVQRA